MQLLIMRAQLTLRKVDLRDMVTRNAEERGYELNSLTGFDQFKNLFASTGESDKAQYKSHPRGIELLWRLVMAMQEPIAEPPAEEKSPTKSPDKKRLTLVQPKLSIDIEPFLSFFEKKITVPKTKLNKMSQT